MTKWLYPAYSKSSSIGRATDLKSVGCGFDSRLIILKLKVHLKFKAQYTYQVNQAQS